MIPLARDGPPDPLLSDTVKKWNEEFVSPKIIIAANSQMMAEFERRDADQIPIVAGDLTPYWKDGAVSTARGDGRQQAGRREVPAQSQILWSMLQPSAPLHERFDIAWHKPTTYDEHTWGAWNSITAPTNVFAVDQDRFKQAYAFDCAILCDALRGCDRIVAKQTSATADATRLPESRRTGLAQP